MKKNIILIIYFLILFNWLFAQTGEIPANTAKTGTNEGIEKLFDNYARELLKMSPELATWLGISKEMGYEISNRDWDDESIKAEDKLYTINKKYRQQLLKYDFSRLTPSQHRAADILLHTLERDLKGEKFRDNSYIISSAGDFHNVMTTIMAEYHNIDNTDDARAYISRLKKYKLKFQQISHRLKIRGQKGILAPKFFIEKFIGILNNFINTSPKNNILYESFSKRVQMLEIPVSQKEALCKEVEKKIETVVYPAYRSMIELLRQLLPKASEEAGVWRLPQGDDYYRYCLNSHTGTGMTPEQIYKLGQKEVRRIQQEIMRQISKRGIDEKLPFNKLWHYFWYLQTQKNRDRVYYPSTQAGRLQVLEDYKRHIDDVAKRLPEYFSIFPKAKLKIGPVPWYKKNLANAHYEAPSLDGKRQGGFYMNLSYTPFKPSMKSLAIHEGIPGHHFQLSIFRELPGIRMFRFLHQYTSYIEGWALYAEKLAMESGWFEDLYSRLGNLESELLRAARLVLDTGIHYKHWSRERAFTYMRDNVGWATLGEIDRYITWPGQACAYKIGQLKIIELREKARKELKSKFHIKDFHTAVLQHGTVPLKILETYVNDYIEKNK